MSFEISKKILIPEKDEHLKLFNMFDTNGDGHISLKEFQNLLKKLGITRNKEEILEMMHLIDKDGNNKLEYSEIINFLKQSDLYDNEEDDAILDAFNVIDKQRKGFITMNDLLFYVRKIGINIPYNIIFEDFKLEDTNKNYRISLIEFKCMIKREKPVTNFKMIADLLVFIDKIEIKTSLNTIYPQTEEVLGISVFLKKIYIFENLPRGRMYSISKNVIKKNYDYREKICDEFSIFKYLYIIFSGEVSVELNTSTFNYCKKTKGCGYIIGLDELRDNKKKYNYSYYPKTNSLIYKIPLNVIKKMMILDHIFHYRIITHYDDNLISLLGKKKLKKIEPKKKCSFSNFGKRLDNTMTQRQVISRINYLKKKKNDEKEFLSKLINKN